MASTPAEISREMSELTDKLFEHVRAYSKAEVDAAKLRCEYDLASAHAYLNAEGSIPERESHVAIKVQDIREQARVAEAVVRAMKMKIRAIEIAIDRCRTEAATVRAELKLIDYGAGA